jgi:photosystem II stability/assembly factor-like uncharacterized protein
LALRRTNASLDSFVSVTLPRVAPIRGLATGSIGTLTFANIDDGYIIEDVGLATKLYVTNDGARSWHLESPGSGDIVNRLTATATSLYTVTMRCNVSRVTCTDFRLAQSSLNARRWTSTPLPNGSSHLDGSVGVVAALGDDVWISELLKTGAILVVSHDDGRTFSTIATPPLGSVSGCFLTPAAGTVLWAECPTGMDVSFFYSKTGGKSWTPIDPAPFSGTGGGAFDPVNGDLAYLAIGLESHDVYRITQDAHHDVVAGTLRCSIVVSLTFTTGSNGVANCIGIGGTSEYLVRTNNGGATWSKVAGY